MKLCRGCGQIKPRRFFHRKKSSHDGYNSRCAPCNTKAARQYELDNAELVKARKAAYYLAHRDHHQAASRRWRERNRARHRQIAREAYERNRAVYIARAAAWNAANPENRREQVRRRRARIAGATVERVDYIEILERHGTVCYLCEEEITPGDLEFDHVIPIARGGAHVASNIRPTHGRCNRSKGARLLSEIDLRAGKEAAAA